MIPLTLAELTSIEGKSDSLRVPRMKPMMMVTTTAVAPASVGVIRPEKMPKKMMPGTIKAYQPDFSALPRFVRYSPAETLPPPSQP